MNIVGENSDDEDEKKVMQLSWRKLEKVHVADGFREGAIAGKDIRLQKSFDEGYGNGFQKSYEIGFGSGEKRIMDFIKKKNESTSFTSELQNSLKKLCDICQK